MSKNLFIATLLFLPWLVGAQAITGMITDEEGKPLAGTVFVEGKEQLFSASGEDGIYLLDSLQPGEYLIAAFSPGYETRLKQARVSAGRTVVLNFDLEEWVQNLEEVTVSEQKEELGASWLQSVSGTAIYEAKKTELIQLDEVIGNKAANVSRQVYARVPGLNIWESDGAGLQLGIGGRGLNPNRTSNFNVRQNGYDISADALGYPESYYTPPTQALEKIEIVRGAAGLQYGTQFGGMLNFRMKEGPKDEKLDVDLKQTVGSFGLYNSFNSLGGTIGKVSYYGFYQYKHSEGWRPNSELDQHTAFASVNYSFTPFLSLKLEHTHMNYLAHQAGGLTDLEFYRDPRQSKRERNWFSVGWDLSAAEFDYRISPRFKINNRTFLLRAHRYAVGNLGRIDRPDDPDEERNLLKDDYRNWGNELRAVTHYVLGGKTSILLVGSRYYRGFTDRKQGSADSGSEARFNFSGSERPYDSDFNFPSQNLAFFAENIFYLGERLSVTPGVRYEFIQTDAEGYFYDRREDLAGNILYERQVFENKRNGRALTLYGVGLSYKRNPLLEGYANFSQNYRSINFNDIRVDNPSLVVDENIHDERGYNLDIGVRGSEEGTFRYDLSVFFLSYKDRIGSVGILDPETTDRTIRLRTNIGDAAILGVESYAELNFLKLLKTELKNQNITGFVNLAVIYSNYLRSRLPVVNNYVELVPPVNLKTGMTYKYRDFALSWLYSFVARQYSDASNASSSPTAVEGIIPAYEVMDLSFSYDWKLFTLESGVNNLLNESYFTRRAAGYPGPGIIPSDGRSFYLTVGVDF